MLGTPYSKLAKTFEQLCTTQKGVLHVKYYKSPLLRAGITACCSGAAAQWLACVYCADFGATLIHSFVALFGRSHQDVATQNLAESARQVRHEQEQGSELSISTVGMSWLVGV